MNFKDKIKELRLEQGFSQTKLAEKLSLSQSCITKLEAGTREPTGSTLVAYSNFFNVSVDYLIGNDEERDQSPTPINTLSQLTDEERELLKFFRAIGKPARDAIFTTAKSFYEQLPADKRVSYTY